MARPLSLADLNYMLAMEEGHRDARAGFPRRLGQRLEITAAQHDGYEEGYRKGLEQMEGYGDGS